MNLFITGLYFICLAKTCHALQCRHWLTREFHFASNRNLQGHVFETKTASSAVFCGRDCSMDPRCASFNYHASSRLCELNDQTRLQRPCTYTAMQGSVYFDDNKNTSPGRDGSQKFNIVGKWTLQSSQHLTFKAGNAVDGSSSTHVSACAHTEKEMNPWWRVDLGGEHCISKVKLLNREGGTHDRLEGVVVRAGDSDSAITDNPTCGSPVTAAQAQSKCTAEIECTPALRARYVSLDIASEELVYLQVCEVTVEEIPLDLCSG